MFDRHFIKDVIKLLRDVSTLEDWLNYIGVVIGGTAIVTWLYWWVR